MKGDQPLFGVALAQRALKGAVAVLAADVKSGLQGGGEARLLVTADEQLAASDGAYLDVTTGLAQLTTAADGLLTALSADEGERVAPVAAIGAIASALPGLVSLFSAQRTVTSSSVTVSDLSAAAATVGALRSQGNLTIVHDDVRLTPDDGAIQKQLTAFQEDRQKLTAKKLELEAAKVATTAAKPPDEALLADQQMRLGLVDGVAQAMDTFMGSLTAIPEGATRSRLTEAVLREQLHGNGEDRFTHVLLVKAGSPE